MENDMNQTQLQGRDYLRGWRLRELMLVLGMAFTSIVLWRVPIIGWLWYPFQVYGTFVHELSHGIATVLTGGEFRRFVVNPDLSGTATSAGGIRWIVVSAGYLGSAAFGGILTLLSASAVPARRVLVALGLILGILSLLFVRNLFGLAAGMVLTTLLVVAGRKLQELWADGLLLLLAVQMMLNAVDSVFGLVQLSALHGTTRTDAQIMAHATGIPAIAWAALWSLLSLVILLASLRVAYYRPPQALDADIARIHNTSSRGRQYD
jgi:hypothetical protein